VQNPAVLERITAKSREVLQVRAFALRDTINSVLERSKVGRSGLPPGPVNPPSAVGDPPARQSGKLINSIQAFRVNDELYEVGPSINSFQDTYEYPVILEFGYGRLRGPRPFMRPGVTEFKAKVLR